MDFSGSPTIERARWGQIHPAGVVLGALAFVWHAALMTSATNDNFLHMTLAQQWLAGDWPVRDFFEHGWVLQYALSAAAQVFTGGRLLGEALIVGVAWGISTWLVFLLVRRTTGSAPIASIAAALLIVASARGYSYPKGIIYAVAALLWWQYVRTPTRRHLVEMAIWAAVAFYWRPDHGIYVAAALALAALVAHGLQWTWVARCALGAVVMIAVVAPFLVYVQFITGLWPYAQTSMVQAQVEHLSHGTHQWPLLRFGSELVDIEPPATYAPIVTLRWREASTTADRARILSRYTLDPLDPPQEAVTRVRLSGEALVNLRALINEPIVDDTAGIDRSTGTILPTSWPEAQRRAFEHAWLRLRFLPALDAQARASEVAVALFHLLPIVLAAAARWIARRLPNGVTAAQLVAFAGFAFLIDFAMLRDPFPARMADAVVLSAIVFGLCIAALWRGSAASSRVGRVGARTMAVVLAAVVVATVAEAAQFSSRLDRLAGGWRSFPRARAAWSEVSSELTALPPLRHYVDRSARFSLRLAAYVRECVPSSDRLLVLWFEPEIYYYSGRLMAQRHLIFAPAWAALAHEQQMALGKVAHHAPPLVLARRSALDDQARATYPGVVQYVDDEYERAAVVEDGGEQYWILARRDRPPVRVFGPQAWPCYVGEASLWSRVGVAPE